MLPTTKRNTVSLRVTVLSVSIVLRTCLLRPAAKGADIMPIASSGEGSAAGRSSVLRATDRSLCSPRLAGQGERGRRAGIYTLRRVADHMLRVPSMGSGRIHISVNVVYLDLFFEGVLL